MLKFRKTMEEKSYEKTRGAALKEAGIICDDQDDEKKRKEKESRVGIFKQPFHQHSNNSVHHKTATNNCPPLPETLSSSKSEHSCRSRDIDTPAQNEYSPNYGQGHHKKKQHSLGDPNAPGAVRVRGIDRVGSSSRMEDDSLDNLKYDMSDKSGKPKRADFGRSNNSSNWIINHNISSVQDQVILEAETVFEPSIAVAETVADKNGEDGERMSRRGTKKYIYCTVCSILVVIVGSIFLGMLLSKKRSTTVDNYPGTPLPTIIQPTITSTPSSVPSALRTSLPSAPIERSNTTITEYMNTQWRYTLSFRSPQLGDSIQEYFARRDISATLFVAPDSVFLKTAMKVGVRYIDKIWGAHVVDMFAQHLMLDREFLLLGDGDPHRRIVTLPDPQSLQLYRNRTVHFSGNNTIEGVPITVKNEFIGVNGAVHQIGGVLFPKWINVTMKDHLERFHPAFYNLLLSNDVAHLLDGDEPKTLVAPRNVTSIVSKEALLMHIFPGQIFAVRDLGLLPGTKHVNITGEAKNEIPTAFIELKTAVGGVSKTATVQSTDLHQCLDNSNRLDRIAWIGDSRILDSDVFVNNGIIQIVDQPLS